MLVFTETSPIVITVNNTSPIVVIGPSSGNSGTTGPTTTGSSSTTSPAPPVVNFGVAIREVSEIGMSNADLRAIVHFAKPLHWECEARHKAPIVRNRSFVQVELVAPPKSGALELSAKNTSKGD